MKASIAVAAAIAAVSAMVLASVAADATHKPYCGERKVVTGTFFGKYKKPGGDVCKQCLGEFKDKGQLLYGSTFTNLEKTGCGCTLQKKGNPYSKYWCVCSGEPCWKPNVVKPGNYQFDKPPFRIPPGGTDLRVPRRSPSDGRVLPAQTLTWRPRRAPAGGSVTAG